MLNILKFDLYKVLHSIWFKVLIILIIPFVLVYYIPNNFNPSILASFLNSLNSLGLFIIFFAVLFGSMDYTNGFEKNITDSNKYFSILSKIVVIFLFTVFIFVALFVLVTICNFIFENSVFYNPYINQENFINQYPNVDSDSWTIGNFFAFTAIKFLLYFALGIGIFLLTLLLRSRIVACVISLLYLFFCQQVFSLINSFFGYSIDVADYSLMHQSSVFTIYNFSLNWDTVLWVGIIYFLIYTALCFVVATFQKSFYGKKLLHLKKN